MDSKEAPPADISGSTTSYGGAVANEGYSPAAGDYPPPAQAGYPEGYSHHPPPGGSYGPPPPVGSYDPPPPGGSYGPPPPRGSYGPPPPGGNYAHPPPGGSYGHPPPSYYPNQQDHTAAGQQGCQQQIVVVSQPRGGSSMLPHAVPDHMVLAIFTTLCCCWPLGLVAMSKASESQKALQQGKLHAAAAFSVESRRYSMWAVAGGCVSLVVIIAVIIAYTSY